MSHNNHPFFIKTGLVFVLVLSCLYFTSAVDLGQLVTICSGLNMSLDDCVSFYNVLSTTCFNPPVQTCTNTTNTVYVNITNSTPIVNCSSELDWRRQEDATKIRLAEIEAGNIEGITEAECNIRVSDEVVKAKSTCLATNSVQEKSSVNYWPYILVGLFGIFVLFFVSKKFMPKDNYKGESYYGSLWGNEDDFHKRRGKKDESNMEKSTKDDF